MKVFYAAFLYSQNGFVIFLQKNVGAKAARKILMKLTKRQNISIGKVMIKKGQ